MVRYLGLCRRAWATFMGSFRHRPMLFSAPHIQGGQPFLASSRQPGWQPVAWPAKISHSAHAVTVLQAARAEWEAQQA